MKYETPKMEATYLEMTDVIVTSLGTGETITDTGMPEVDMSGGMN